MSSERIIQVADLSLILGSLRSLQSDIGTVSNQVDNVGHDLSQTRAELSRLEQAFADFVEADLKAKELSLAETRQVKIRQEIENTFGQNAVVRRQATGILQASDIQLVRQETIRGATEELMLSTPRYWLAPALVALAAWLGDNRDLAQRALAEAVRRDDEKTSLFFALISRRAGRSEANRTWLDRYFGLQNPHQLDRQTVVMVDAMANGVFNADTTQLCSKRITAWIEELSQQAGFAEAQRSQWSDALRSKTPHADHADDYPHLSRFSPTWGALGTSLNEASMQSAVLQHFEQVFQGEIKPASSVLVAVDDLLTKLVTRFDDEELPLRRQEELCRLIIEESGDKRAAQSRYDLQSKTLDTQVDFTQLLTNAAMHPETSHVTRATQRFAIAHSRDWILDAHSDVTAKARQKVPQRIELQLEDWSGQTSAGENEAELLASLASHLDQREAEALAGAKLGLKHWGAVAIGAVLVLMSVSYGMVSLVLGLAALGWAYLGHRTVQKLRIKIREDFARLKTQSAQALRACMAETVELRRDLAQRDGVSANVTALLESISPAQHLLSGHDNVRRVMAA
ncbi:MULTISPECIES: hypothetical protein [Comamonas]|uniref:hypothetical protein n=1 Tax=Comamonas TaxID=283 RepID=UPI001C4667D2|nr:MULTISPECIES: hypothetical protein [Comamonas]MBV7417805.1 hypothetical protein [Comamonas sp. CMM03]MDH0049744.1 hypothetical protein [Comamonas terrigena]MDH0512492.1 hypothetical protein [Comamonas terrigena]MDH1092018.1 hypothetical protein [Comamonas terrigena]MDH1501320.1 hypothetical protein [Comamonas terrigena]